MPSVKSQPISCDFIINVSIKLAEWPSDACSYLLLGPTSLSEKCKVLMKQRISSHFTCFCFIHARNCF